MKNRLGKKPPEGELINILDEISPLEWFRFQRRYVITDVKRMDHLTKTKEPPYIVFRFENESSQLITLLRKLIEEYEGKVKWVLTCHKRINLPGINWGIHIKRTQDVKDIAESLDLSDREYIARYEPELSDKAFEDLNTLTAFLKERLFKIYDI